MRSFLFVPGDSQKKFESAKKTAADALILDLEDSIAPDQKIVAREITRGMLDARNPLQKIYIRVNALDTDMTLGDLAAVMPGKPDGIVLPKCAGAADVNKLALYLDAFEAASGIAQGATRIVTVATETARAVTKLFDIENMSPRLWGMMWGAEDLAASLGASRNRTDGRFHSPFLAGARPLPDCRGGRGRRRHRHHRDRHQRPRCAAGGVDRGAPGRFSRQGRDPSQTRRRRQCRLHADGRGNRLVGTGPRGIRGQSVRRREDGRQDAGQAASSRRGEDPGDAAAIARDRMLSRRRRRSSSNRCSANYDDRAPAADL
jgi:hypothetical protein